MDGIACTGWHGRDAIALGVGGERPIKRREHGGCPGMQRQSTQHRREEPWLAGSSARQAVGVESLHTGAARHGGSRVESSAHGGVVEVIRSRRMGARSPFSKARGRENAACVSRPATPPLGGTVRTTLMTGLAPPLLRSRSHGKLAPWFAKHQKNQRPNATANLGLAMCSDHDRLGLSAPDRCPISRHRSFQGLAPRLGIQLTLLSWPQCKAKPYKTSFPHFVSCQLLPDLQARRLSCLALPDTTRVPTLCVSHSLMLCHVEIFIYIQSFIIHQDTKTQRTRRKHRDPKNLRPRPGRTASNKRGRSPRFHALPPGVQPL